MQTLTSLLGGKKDDEGNNDNEEQRDNGNKADFQRGPTGLLCRFWGIGLCHSQVSSFTSQLYQLT